MTRAHYYQTQIAVKLLSSKFIYSSILNQGCVKKLTIKSKAKTKNPEVGSANLTIICGRRPSFTKTLQRQDKEYRLAHLLLTSNKKQVALNLDLIASALLPFQFENRFCFPKSRKENEISWTLDNCTPATPLHPIIFPYPIVDDTFNITITVLSHKHSHTTETTFYLNLFQLPIIAA